MNFEDEIPPAEAVFAVLARVEDRLSRLDERVRSSGFMAGWQGRADVRAVTGAMWGEGELVHPEDLILHDLGTDVRIADLAVGKARRLLQAHRKAHRGGPELLSWNGVAWLAGLARQPPPPGPRPTTRIDEDRAGPRGYAALARYFERLAKGQTDTPRAGVEDCLMVLDVPGIPAALSAAALMEAWRIVDPLPRNRAIGFLAASIHLIAAGRFKSGLVPIEVALRRRPIPERLEWSSLGERLTFWLSLMEVAVDMELDELTRLGHQKGLIERRANGGRSSSRAPDLAKLAIDTPVMTMESISKALGITPQASLQLVRRMGPALQEITGRSRYRVWRL